MNKEQLLALCGIVACVLLPGDRRIAVLHSKLSQQRIFRRYVPTLVKYYSRLSS